jgi:pyrimidine operon attenuation protein/uracil phosphoribosyltransferase
MSRTAPIMDADALSLAVARIAHEIAETLATSDPVVVLGIQQGGAGMGRRLAAELARIRRQPVPHGTIDGGMHRDDLEQRPDVQLHPTEIPGEIDGRIVILADDVIASGRTVRAAMDALHNHGRPRAVRLAVLIDRGRRELPIQPDHRGRTVETAAKDRVEVKWLEEHGEDAVHLVPA